MTQRTVTLRKPLARALAEGHPWVFRDALADASAFEAGDIATIVDARGDFVARGIADDGPIGVRVWTLHDEPVDGALLARRFAAAAALRDRVVPPETDCYRLLHGEGDRTPGVVCDVYGSCATVQLDGAGATACCDDVLDALDAVLPARGVTTVLVRTGKRGERQVELARGPEPDDVISVRERGMTLFCDLLSGQKTGLFLDHRESRHRIRGLSRGARVLNLYGYTGGFSAAAALGGARHVVTVDVARGAIALAERTVRENAPRVPHDAIASDVPAYLEQAAADGETFDIVIADPPSFAPSERALPAARKSYTALHEACLRVLAPGGLYLAASCSSHVDRDDFDATLRDAARRSDVMLQVLDRWGAPPDHPRLMGFPEGDYLKCVLVRR